MNRLIKEIFSITSWITSFAFTLMPESLFFGDFLELNCSRDVIVVLNRIALILIVLFVILVIKIIYRYNRCSILIKGSGYKIKVEYGDIFKVKNCKKIISFDECFITNVGEAPDEIKPSSVCGKFLTRSDIDKNEVEQTILKYKSSHIPSGRSAYQNKPCYQSGILIPFKETYLLLAFGKLDEKGLCQMTREEYLACLEILWAEIYANHAQHDVAIPVLGSGVAHFKGETLTQQQLVDMLIASYKLSTNKMQHNALRIIVYRGNEDFSLNRVGEYI